MTILTLIDSLFGLLFVGISSVLFESRIGCLDAKVPKETETFISSINTMFVMTLLTMAMPKFLHHIFPKPWQKFCESWDYMFQFGESHRQVLSAPEKQVACIVGD